MQALDSGTGTDVLAAASTYRGSAVLPMLSLCPCHPPSPTLQLFHVAVVVAACVHYKSVRILLAWRDASGGCLPPLDSLAPPMGPPLLGA